MKPLLILAALAALYLLLFTPRVDDRLPELTSAQRAEVVIRWSH